MKEVYVVTAYRFGSMKSHSYTVGVYLTEKDARDSAEDVEIHRGRKYLCAIELFDINTTVRSIIMTTEDVRNYDW